MIIFCDKSMIKLYDKIRSIFTDSVDPKRSKAKVTDDMQDRFVYLVDKVIHNSGIKITQNTVFSKVMDINQMINLGIFVEEEFNIVLSEEEMLKFYDQNIHAFLTEIAILKAV